MKTKLLNLVNVNESEIKYRIDNYPDGQVHLVLEDLNDNKFIMKILCRIRNSDDIFILMQLSDIINRRGLRCMIDIKYLLTARTDRLFSWNEAFDLKIVSDIINSFNPELVNLLDVHSEVSEKLIKNSMNSSMISYLANHKDIEPNVFDESSIIVAPDKGAYDRLKTEYMNIFKIIQCDKKRDSSGKVCNVDINLMNNDIYKWNNLIVLDDLCDGGGTFMAIYPKLKELGAKSINLMITHAIQESGIRKVASVYDRVIISNSYKDWNNVDLPFNVSVINVLD